jgi:glutamate dehydrogenase/leucine dehydrogenase
MHDEKWTEEEVNGKLDHMISKSFGQVWSRAQIDHISLKDAAFVVALEKLK